MTKYIFFSKTAKRSEEADEEAEIGEGEDEDALDAREDAEEEAQSNQEAEALIKSVSETQTRYMEAIRELLGDSGGVLPEDKAKEMAVRGLRVLAAGCDWVIRGEKVKQEGLRVLATALAGSSVEKFWSVFKGAFGIPDSPEEGGRYAPLGGGPSTSKSTPQKRRSSTEGTNPPQAKFAKGDFTAFIPHGPETHSTIGIDKDLIPMARVVDKTSTYQCVLCDTRITDIEVFASHMRRDHLQQTLVCYLCGTVKSFFTVRAWKKHMKNDHKGVDMFPPVGFEADQLLTTLGVNVPEGV
jgi:hypothetical protein